VPHLRVLRHGFRRPPRVTKGKHPRVSLETRRVARAPGIIQGPAFFLAGESAADVAAGERQWALAGLVVTLGGFVSYLVYQVKSTDVEASKQMKQESVIKSMMMKGEVSLATAGVFISTTRGATRADRRRARWRTSSRTSTTAARPARTARSASRTRPR
jgi:hypothetical protein